MTSYQWLGLWLTSLKPYNLLPRMPLLAIGLHLGLPKPIVRAWANALAQLSLEAPLAHHCIRPQVLQKDVVSVVVPCFCVISR